MNSKQNNLIYTNQHKGHLINVLKSDNKFKILVDGKTISEQLDMNNAIQFAKSQVITLLK